MDSATVRPVRIKLRSELMQADVLSTVAYRGQCPDGWRGPQRDRYADARTDARDHNRLCHRRRG